jgi:hypothetical protein
MKFSVLLLAIIFVISCQSTNLESQSKPTEEFNKYWYNGDAEITSYRLVQARYGELREGEAVMIFVTEHFSKRSFTKSDVVKGNDVPVLKLNFTKNFETGIYPYSMMNSSFFPVSNGKHSLKVSSSSQEWCGHTYMELLNKGNFELNIHSYFQGEGLNKKSVKRAYIEDDLWSIIRLNPGQLPLGNLEMYPSFFYLRMIHKDAIPYKCTASIKTMGQSTIYTVAYPQLERSLSIEYEAKFPYKILRWEETYPDGKDRKILTTKGEMLKQIKSDYWTKNKSQFSYLRDTLELK